MKKGLIRFGLLLLVALYLMLGSCLDITAETQHSSKITSEMAVSFSIEIDVTDDEDASSLDQYLVSGTLPDLTYCSTIPEIQNHLFSNIWEPPCS